MGMIFTVYSSEGSVPFFTVEQAMEWGKKLAARGIESECRDSNFDHVFTMGEN